MIGSWLSRQTLRRIEVHTTEGRTLSGTLRTVARDGLVLSVARYLDDDIALGGDVFVPREQIAFIQA